MSDLKENLVYIDWIKRNVFFAQHEAYLANRDAWLSSSEAQQAMSYILIAMQNAYQAESNSIISAQESEDAEYKAWLALNEAMHAERASYLAEVREFQNDDEIAQYELNKTYSEQYAKTLEIQQYDTRILRQNKILQLSALLDLKDINKQKGNQNKNCNISSRDIFEHKEEIQNKENEDMLLDSQLQYENDNKKSNNGSIETIECDKQSATQEKEANVQLEEIKISEYIDTNLLKNIAETRSMQSIKDYQIAIDEINNAVNAKNNANLRESVANQVKLNANFMLKNSKKESYNYQDNLDETNKLFSSLISLTDHINQSKKKQINTDFIANNKQLKLIS
ncbi:MAG: hypothetical protein AB1782_07650 [Cyanobacteriota bacterium]